MGPTGAKPFIIAGAVIEPTGTGMAGGPTGLPGMPGGIMYGEAVENGPEGIPSGAVVSGPEPTPGGAMVSGPEPMYPGTVCPGGMFCMVSMGRLPACHGARVIDPGCVPGKPYNPAGPGAIIGAV